MGRGDDVLYVEVQNSAFSLCSFSEPIIQPTRMLHANSSLNENRLAAGTFSASSKNYVVFDMGSNERI